MLPEPVLDDRTWEQLRDELLAKLRQRHPEYDTSPADPGIVLIEAACDLAELIIYRLNQVPRKVYLAFLNFLNTELQEALPHKVPVVFTLAAPLGFDLTIPKGTEVSSLQTETQDAISYLTDVDLTIPAGQTTGTVTATCAVPGDKGKVGAGALVVLKNAIPYVASVTNPEPAYGGRNEESIEEAGLRTAQELRTNDRAVTPQDFEDIVKKSNPLSVAKVKAVPVWDGTQTKSGAVTVYVVPSDGGVLSPSLSDSIYEYVKARTFEECELHVLTAPYVLVDIAATVTCENGADKTAVQAAAESALRSEYDPTKRMFGRPGYPSVATFLLQGISGVKRVQVTEYKRSTSPDGTVEDIVPQEYETLKLNRLVVTVA